MYKKQPCDAVVFLCSVGLGGYFICAECSGVMVGQKIV